MKRMLSFVLAFAMVFTSVITTDVSHAETDPVRIWNAQNGKNEMNKSISIGITTDKYVTYKLSGITEESHQWSSSDTDKMVVNGNEETVSMTGVGEGYARLQLEVTDTDGNTYDDYTHISVYTPVTEETVGYTTSESMVTRSATDSTENLNPRGYVPANTKMSVIGICGDYYRVVVDYDFDDGLDNHYGYIKKGAVSIPVTGIELDVTELHLHKGNRKELNAKIKPALASNKDVIWESDDTSIVEVDSEGLITAKKEGVANVKAISAGGESIDQCAVEVSGVDEQGESLVITTPKKEIEVNEQVQLEAEEPVKWESCNKKIATVSNEGVVTGKREGKVKIKAFSSTKGSASVVLSVTPKQYFKTDKVSYKGGKRKYNIPKKFRNRNYRWKVVRYSKKLRIKKKGNLGNKKIKVIVPKRKGADSKVYNCHIKIYRCETNEHVADYLITIHQKWFPKAHYRKAMRNLAKDCKKCKLKYTAKYLKHSAQDDPSDIYESEDSDIAKKIKATKVYKERMKQVRKKLKTSKKNRAKGIEDGVVFGTSYPDLMLSIHRAEFKWKAKKKADRWEIVVSVDDDFNYEPWKRITKKEVRNPAKRQIMKIIRIYNNYAAKAFKEKGVNEYHITIRIEDKY